MPNTPGVNPHALRRREADRFGWRRLQLTEKARCLAPTTGRRMRQEMRQVDVTMHRPLQEKGSSSTAFAALVMGD